MSPKRFIPLFLFIILSGLVSNVVAEPRHDPIVLPTKDYLISQETDTILTKSTGEIEISKWNKEATVLVKTPETPEYFSLFGEIDRLTYPGYTVEVMQIDNGIKHNIILPSNPGTNVFYYDVEQTDGLTFYYQPSLTENQYPNGWTVNDTHAFDENGTLRERRPIDVVGSYAVYYEKQNDQYKTGKFMHIYRPEIIDSKGRTIWGEMDYDEQTSQLSITVDQTWLNNAVYPVTVDPSFGYDDAGSTWSTFQANTIIGTLFPLSEDATLTTIWAFVGGAGFGQFQTKAGVYETTDQGGGTYSLVAGSDEVEIGTPVTARWLEHDIEDTEASADDYFLVLWRDDVQPFHYDVGGDNWWHESFTYGTETSWPDPIDLDEQGDNRIYSIYCNYTAGAEPTNYTRDADQALSVVYDAERVIAFGRTGTQALSAVYEAARIQGHVRAGTQALNAVYDGERVIGFGRTGTQALNGVYDAARTGVAFGRTGTQALNAVYDAERVKALIRAATQALSGVYDGERVIAFGRTGTQALNGGYEASRLRDIIRSATQALSGVYEAARSYQGHRGTTLSLITTYDGTGTGGVVPVDMFQGAMNTFGIMAVIVALFSGLAVANGIMRGEVQITGQWWILMFGLLIAVIAAVTAVVNNLR